MPLGTPFSEREVKPPRYLVVHHTALTDDVQLVKVNESHRRQGYSLSSYGYYVAYHFFIGRDGTLIQTRDLTDRTPHTSNSGVQMESISVVFAGNFNVQHPSQEQMDTFRDLYRHLYKGYDIERLVGHKHTLQTECPGKNLSAVLDSMFNPDERLQLFDLSRYYTPVRGQQKYYRDTYEEDASINCNTIYKSENGLTVSANEILKDDDGYYYIVGGHAYDVTREFGCMNTANGTKLDNSMAMKVAACPPNYPFGTKLDIEGYGEVTCVDRGGAIKGNRIDIWAGIAEDGLRNIAQSTAGIHYGKVVYSPPSK